MNIYTLSIIYSQFGNIRNEIGRGIARKYASPRWRAVTNRLLNAGRGEHGGAGEGSAVDLGEGELAKEIGWTS